MKTALGLTYLTIEIEGNQAMVALTTDRQYAFVWQGGGCIDVYARTQFHADQGRIQINYETYFVGEECINVWDYSKKAPEIDWLDETEYLYVINEWLGYR